MDLIRDLDNDPVKRTIVKNTLKMLKELGVSPLCEGIETMGEYDALRDMGVSLMQGYLFAKPAFAALGTPQWPQTTLRVSAA
jgi:EAL domain-containing protein (putative c-di-GMP-specific phosphodiesterase class I)